MKSGEAMSSCVYVLSDKVDLLFACSSRFCCFGADDGQAQAIRRERSHIEMEAWTRDGSKDGWIPGS